MWELNYNDIFHPTISTSTSDIGSGSVPLWYQQMEYLELIEEALLDAGGIPKAVWGRDAERKRKRKQVRRRRIQGKMNRLLLGIPVEAKDLFSDSDLHLLHELVMGERAYDYWPIPKILTRKLRGLVKKQRRTVIVSLFEYVRIVAN